jgi:hypothetical protein
VSSLLAMRIGDTRPFIDRNYRDITLPGQLLRETFRNAQEAGASNVHFGIEWQGVEAQRVYRRYIADDGIGMDERDLTQFMLTYGGGGKPIGTEHENFGIGAKVALLPWNPAGLLVISYKECEGYAMLVRGEERDYGAFPWEAVDDDGEVVHTAVIDPEGATLGAFGIADIGSIWSQVPFWAERDEQPEHGTIFLLLGPDSDYDTILGDPGRPEEAVTYMQAQFLNSRLWELPEDQNVTVDVSISPDKNTWTPKNPGKIESGPGTGGFSRRKIVGAKWHIGRAGKFAAASGSVTLDDEGTVAHWWLRDENPERRPNPYGPRAGFISVLYNEELYDIARSEDARWRYRQFGIPAAEVMSRTFIVIAPPIDGPSGIYPTGGRDRLRRTGGRDLPFTDWGATFHENLPVEIAKAIEEAMPKEIVADSSWKEKFAERFWDRLQHIRFRHGSDGQPGAAAPAQAAPRTATRPTTETETTSQDGGTTTLPRVAKPRQRTKEPTVSDTPGPRNARKADMEASIPSWLPVPADEMDQPYTLASWEVKEMAGDYSVTTDDVAAWSTVERAVWETVGQSLVAKVVHVQSVLRRDVERTTLRNDYLSDVARTTAGLGMVWEQQALQPKLGGILGRRKAS